MNIGAEEISMPFARELAMAEIANLDVAIWFRVRGPFEGLLFARRPINVIPDEGTTGFVNNNERQVPARFLDGEWQTLRGRPITWGPTHWTVIESETA